MEIIQVVLGAKLLRATDRGAQRTNRNRCALIRDALREHLLKLKVRTLELRDRDGHSKRPHAEDEMDLWEVEVRG